MAKISVSSSPEKEMAQVEKAVETHTVKSKAKGNDAGRKVSKRSRSTGSRKSKNSEPDASGDNSHLKCKTWKSESPRTYPLDSFSVSQNDLNRFRTMMLYCISEWKKWDVPSVFVVCGPKNCGKTSLINSLFENDDFNACFHQDIPFHPAEICDLHIINHPSPLDAGSISLCIKRGVVLIELNDGEDFSNWNEVIMTLKMRQLSAASISDELNCILRESGVSADLKITEADLQNGRRDLVDLDSEKRMLAHTLLIQKKFPLKKDSHFTGIIDPEKFYSRYNVNKDEIEDNILINAEYSKVYGIFRRLNKPARHILADDKKVIEKLDDLLAQHPNIINNGIMKSVIRGAFYLSKTKELHIPPLIFVGPPGCGKSFFVSQFREILGQDNDCFIPLGTGRGVDALMGSTQSYKDATHGLILASAWTALDDACCFNPIVQLDEIDKACLGQKISDKNQDILPPLLQLLGDVNMEKFQDAFFDVPLNDFRPSFIATANSLEGIPDPLLNRFVGVITFRDYSEDEFLNLVIPAQYALFKKSYGKSLPGKLGERERMAIYSLAQGKTRCIQTAILRFFTGHLDDKGKLRPTNEDVIKRLLEETNAVEARNTIGFCR